MRHLAVGRGEFVRISGLRSNMLRAARDWFAQRQFMEIQVPHITGATGSCEWFPNAMNVTMHDATGEEMALFLRQTAEL